MITQKELINEIREFCINNANEENIKKSQRYFKEKYNGYGLSTIQINTKANEILSSKCVSIDTVLEAMPSILKYDKFDEISCGLMIINGLSNEYSKKKFFEIANLYSMGITNWAHADVLGMYILPKFLINGIIEISDFKNWMESPNKFMRRSVPVTFIKALKKDKDCRKYIEFIQDLIHDNAREVHQGVGWFLRESWKINKNLTEDYLLKWKKSAPRLIIQYACEKMTPEEKLKFKMER